MKQRCIVLAALSFVIQFVPPQSKAEGSPDLMEIGFARISFNPSSSQLSGQQGTTPPGATVDLDDANTLGLVYERRLIGPFSLALQTGMPPRVKLFGKGTAVSLGEVGEARAWFPAVLGVYALPQLWSLAPYVGVGVNYTFFTDNQITDSYTKAFGGTNSTASLSRRAGAVGKIGTRLATATRWSLDLSYSRYWISTNATVMTDTPGFGTLTRRLDVLANPDVFGISFAYSF